VLPTFIPILSPDIEAGLGGELEPHLVSLFFQLASVWKFKNHFQDLFAANRETSLGGKQV
jgi:hypothetical protein